MHIVTKIFGEIYVDEEKKITFPRGIVGFPELTDFMLIHDADSKDPDGGGIRWLQSLQEPAFAMPVMDPLIILPDYNPTIEDELLKPIGKLYPENMLVLVTVTVPVDIKNLSVNLKAPLIINGDTKKAVQVILDDDYEVKHYIYEQLDKAKKEREKASN
ncbi:MAG: flagellar assembly protein FliW [Lachnospiraceae bacterium]|nr:flagellar assembly protein FliW [Lachnospiraceae bacterium]